MRASFLRLCGTVSALMIGALGTAFANPTAQQNCDKSRVNAWKIYASCVEKQLANQAGGISFSQSVAFAKCRHTYLKKWMIFQARPLLAGSTCIGDRYTDNGDGTVTDNLSDLVWETKTDDDSIHDQDNLYTWSTGAPYAGNGTLFTGFLGTLNSGPGFADTNDWRQPTLAELQTIELDFPCTGVGGGPTCRCPSSPCVDPALGLTQSSSYWSVTTYVPNPAGAWNVYFGGGDPGLDDKTNQVYVRAVRGGF